MDIIDNEKKVKRSQLSEGIEAVTGSEPAKKAVKDELAKATDSSKVWKMRRLSQLQLMSQTVSSSFSESRPALNLRRRTKISLQHWNTKISNYQRIQSMLVMLYALMRSLMAGTAHGMAVWYGFQAPDSTI